MTRTAELPENVRLPWLRPLWRQFIQAREHGRLGHALGIRWQPELGTDRLLNSLSQWLLCHQAGPTACHQCKACQLWRSGSHPDFIQVSPEADKAIGIDEVRAIQQRVQQTAALAQHKVVLVTAAQQLSTAAANALLKTLEEPPAETFILVAASDFTRLPATIRSRLTIFPVPVPDAAQLTHWLGQYVAPQSWSAAWLESRRQRPLAALQQALSYTGPDLPPRELVLSSHVSELPATLAETMAWLDERLRALQQLLQNAAPAQYGPLLRHYRSGCRLKADLQKSGLNKSVLVQHWLLPVQEALRGID